MDKPRSKIEVGTEVDAFERINVQLWSNLRLHRTSSFQELRRIFSRVAKRGNVTVLAPPAPFAEPL